MDTKREVTAGAEEVLGVEARCLGHGFIRLVDYMGGDEAIVQAARVSYGKGTRTVSEDRGLIRRLMRDDHTSPFEMVEMKWHCKMPVFVARQWVRHRTANINEYSLRYSEPINEFYVPELGEVRFQSVTNRQGSSEKQVPEETARRVIDFLKENSERSMNGYNELNQEKIARELARVGLPVNLYTQWYWKNDLRNTFNFLRLRLAEDAQYEIRVYAEAMAGIVKKVAPIAYEAFEDYVLNSIRLSALEIGAIRGIFAGRSAGDAVEAMKNKRERTEFARKLGRLMGQDIKTAEQ